MSDKVEKVVIIGSGPAGCTAAIYASRAGLEPVLVTGSDQGGQLTTTPEIANWPGESGTPSGFELMDKMQKHAKSLGTRFVSSEVKSSSLRGQVKELTLASGEVLKASAVIIATGAKPRYLGLESETHYKGHGVSACATCDGFFYRGKDVAVVGGGSAAFTEALFLCNICRKVYLVHRRDGFRAEKALVDKMRAAAASGKAELVLGAVVSEVEGDGNAVSGIKVALNDGSTREIPVSGVFMAIGHVPATAVFKGEVETDAEGYITTGHGFETATSAEGVFAAGDCADRIYRQAITSAGQGCKAALDAERYLA
ncbi:MAG: thioredoxin-disulfide reductase [Aeromonadales bacterium]|nr:thioredoxin-disulfide reductase [Aeromonadales bacterium]MDY2890742.1 thioredoxin-disulfide reductase [Succinivibrio sp.]